MWSGALILPAVAWLAGTAVAGEDAGSPPGPRTPAVQPVLPAADGEPRTQPPAVPPGSVEIQAPPPSPSAAPAPVPAATDPETPAPAPRPGTPPGPAAASPQPGRARAPATRWPIEYVRRPQTLPQSMSAAGIVWEYRRADPSYITHDAFGLPTPFHSTTAGGLSGSLGLTDDIEIGAAVPRVVCFASADPSGCSSFNRWNGTGLGLGWRVVHGAKASLRIDGGVSVSYSSPNIYGGRLGARSKHLIGDRIALELGVAVRRDLNTPPLFPPPSTRVTFIADLNVQVTRHLLIFGDLVPYAPVDHLDAPDLEPLAGLSWSFTPYVEVGAKIGTFNMLARRSWDRSVPESFATLGITFWFEGFPMEDTAGMPAM